MYKTHRYKSLPCFMLSSMFLLCGCTTSTKSTVTSSPQDTSLSSTKLVDSGTGGGRDGSTRPARSASPSATSDPDAGQIGGSKTPSEWVYSKDKAVACRINKWSSYSLQTDIDFEFSNLKSEKPVNIVYTLVPKGKNGEIFRFFNEYTDKQSDITTFNPPLKKGQSKVNNYVRKFAGAPVSLNLQGCRVAKKGEDFWTINPEMRNYVGP
jgi:hypothetical protein